MEYIKAECMRQEFIVALQYKDIFPNRPEEIAKKYSAEQWVECGNAIIEHMKNETQTLYEMLGLIEMIRMAE